MTTFYARVLDAETGGEGAYTFDGPADLMSKTADEIVAAFFDEVEAEVLHKHVDWELNGILKNKEREVVTAIGSLISGKGDAPMPFMLMISSRG